ncbi:MAG: DNA repair protein RecO [Bacteroidota bacterium]
MLHKTRGVVFRFTRYGETSIIVTIFTEAFGLQTYMVNGVRSKTSKNKIALYQPLTLLDLVVYHKEHASILRIKELKCLYPYQTIGTDVHKSTIALFLNEILNKTVKEESHAGDLCQFLIDALTTLDQMKTGVENFHLSFLILLSRHLGFGPQRAEEILGGRLLSEPEEKILQEMIDADYRVPFALTNTQRRNILDTLLHFYAVHIETMGEIKSVQVLREVLG